MFYADVLLLDDPTAMPRLENDMSKCPNHKMTTCNNREVLADVLRCNVLTTRRSCS